MTRLPLINTPLQRGGSRGAVPGNRFSGLLRRAKTAEAVLEFCDLTFTPQKRCVNEKGPFGNTKLVETHTNE
jgi:hypothetical protein